MRSTGHAGVQIYLYEMLSSVGSMSTDLNSLFRNNLWQNSEKIMEPDIPHALRLQGILIGRSL